MKAGARKAIDGARPDKRVKIELQNSALLSSFLMVAKTRSFTEAAQRLNLRQSTVSQHVRKLEDALRCRLFDRDTHSVRLTADGDAMVEFGHGILESHGRVDRYFSSSERRVRIRLGISEDFAISGLTDVLRMFMQNHPAVDLELTVGLSRLLYTKLDDGELDLLFSKRLPGDTRGDLVWRERLVWVGREGWRGSDEDAIPLVVFPLPSITRTLAIDALLRADRMWRIVCTSSSLSGIWAAALAGIGVTAQSGTLIPPGLAVLPSAGGLPELSIVDFVLVRATTTLNNSHISALATMIVENRPILAGCDVSPPE